MQSELDQALNELKQGDENAKKAQADADRILEELKQEQAHLEHIERIKNGYEAQLRVYNCIKSSPNRFKNFSFFFIIATFI